MSVYSVSVKKINADKALIKESLPNNFRVVAGEGPIYSITGVGVVCAVAEVVKKRIVFQFAEGGYAGIVAEDLRCRLEEKFVENKNGK